MMFSGNVRMALSSLGRARLRSLLTMLGIIIGVLSVVTTVSIGEGVRQQVRGQINQYGPNLLTVRSGVPLAQHNALNNLNNVANLSLASLTEDDLKTIMSTPNVDAAAPISIITNGAKTDDTTLDDSLIVATNESLPAVINQKIAYGAFFNEYDNNQNAVVIGKKIAEKLFHENVPTGRSLKIRGHTFVVKGVFETFQTNPVTTALDFNSAIFIRYAEGKALNSNVAPIQQVLVKPIDSSDKVKLRSHIEEALLKAHAGQHDFVVLSQADNLAATSQLVNILTALVASVAAVSLLVGGLGVMNIMLVSISERTHEIGIRKGIGATNRQILSQFMIEATTLSLCGGVIGLLFSVLANYLLRIFTDLTPLITWPIMVVALCMVLVVGLISGVTPALKAARKDPIEALRHE